MNILLVDDSYTMRNIEKKVLSRALPEAVFVEAADGLEGLAAIAAEPAGFGLMIIDWNMPNLDGIGLVTKIRETDKKTLIIMATTEAEKTQVLLAIRAGVSNYVVKPFSAESLIAKVTQTLAKAKAA